MSNTNKFGIYPRIGISQFIPLLFNIMESIVLAYGLDLENGKDILLENGYRLILEG